MKNISLNKLTPYLFAIVIFYLITAIYFLPLIQGKQINQSDIIHYQGGSKEIQDFRDKTGEEALWTNSMFGGMPAFQISVVYSPTILTYIQKVLKAGLPGVASIVFLYFLGFYFLLLVLRVNPWLAIVGALAFGFSSYFFIIIEAGHNTKALAIAYMSPIIAGIVLAYRKKWLFGFVVTAIFAGLEIFANHYQMTYYLLFVIVIFIIYEFWDSLKNKTYIDFFKSSSVLVSAAIIAVLLNLPGLWSTYEYGKETMRGKSELSSPGQKANSGLDKDYITQWSYGIQETLSLIVPNAKGGATSSLSDDNKALQKVDSRWRQNVGSANHYWGNQPFTSGPVYVGAIILFMFIFGLFVVKGKFKWILLIATIISVMLSWGKNFMPLTDLFIDYMPLYNKFRAVSMTLVIAELCIPLLAMLALSQIISDPGLINKKRNKLYIALGLTGGILFVLYLFPTIFLSFLSKNEITQFAALRQSNDANVISQFIDNLEAARIYIFRADTLRSLFYILISFILLFLYGYKKISTKYFIFLLGILVLIDMLPINRRYLNDEDFVRKSTYAKSFQPSNADIEILKDKNIFRVLNLSTDTYQETATSYFHQSIGGYSAAKLGRYQDIIENNISIESELLRNSLANISNQQSLEVVLSKLAVLNMLNTKYIILNPNQKPLVNTKALGNAWFVNKFYYAKDANEEINALKQINSANEAVFDTKYRAMVEGKNISYDSIATIVLTSYEPNQLIYETESQTNQFAVFSEIYYDNGWNAYIDGIKSDYYRANYVLRAMIIPAGKHKIEFRFEPKSYFIGNLISKFASIFLILIILSIIIFELKKTGAIQWLKIRK